MYIFLRYKVKTVPSSVVYSAASKHERRLEEKSVVGTDAQEAGMITALR